MERQAVAVGHQGCCNSARTFIVQECDWIGWLVSEELHGVSAILGSQDGTTDAHWCLRNLEVSLEGNPKERKQ